MSGKNTPLDKLNSSLGAKIRSLRKARHLKISELAEKTGLTASMISQMERAIISPSIATLKKICDVMDIPISYLFEEAEAVAGEGIDGEASDLVTDNPFGAGIFPSTQIDQETYLKMFPPVNLMGLSPVVHKKNRKILSPGEGIRFYLLNPILAGPIELIYNEYDPGSSTGPVKYSHPGSECGLILSGELIVEIKDKVYVLKEGDSITFNCSEPHLKRNDSDKMCTCVWANVPPWF